MRKSDLKTGMIVEFEKDEFALVWGNSLVGINMGGGKSIKYINEDLVWHYSKTYVPINKVYSEPIDASESGMFWKCQANNFKNHTLLTCTLLWERKSIETIEIAGQKFNKEEVENALRNLKPIK